MFSGKQVNRVHWSVEEAGHVVDQTQAPGDVKSHRVQVKEKVGPDAGLPLGAGQRTSVRYREKPSSWT